MGKTMLNDIVLVMQDIYFFVKFGLVLIYNLRFIAKNPFVIFLDRHQRFIRWDGRGNNYFFCFPLPHANEHLFNSKRFLSLIFTRSICNSHTDSWWDLFSVDICIFMDANKTFQSDIVRIWVHIKLSPFYYKANALTNWDLHPYPPLSISHLPIPTPSQNLSSNLFPKCIRNKGWFIFFCKRLEEKNNKK